MAATSGGIRAGRAFVEIFADSSKLQSGLKSASAQLGKFGSSVTSIGTKFLASGAGIGAAFALPLKLAGDFNETASKFGVVFGENSAAAKKWADTFAAEVGRGRAEVTEFLANSRAVLDPFGFDKAKADELSKTLVRLAVDLASFHNTTDADAMQALISGLMGEVEPLKRFGIVVNETRAKAQALTEGVDWSKATEGEKVLSRMAVILRDSVQAQGDAARTADSFSNSLKALKGAAADAAIEVGQSLVLGARDAVVVGREVAKVLGLAAQTLPQVATGAVKAAGGLVAVGTGMLGLGIAANTTASVLGLFTATGLFGKIAAGAAVAAVAAGVWSGAWDTAVEGVSTQLSGLPARIAEVNAAAREAFESGDVEGAQKIMLAGLEAEQARFLTTSKQAWEQWGDYVANVLKAAFGGLFGGGPGRQIPVPRVGMGGQVGPERDAAIRQQVAAERANDRIGLSEGIKADVAAKGQAGEAGGFLLHIEGLLAEGMARLFSGSAAGDAAAENAAILSGQANDQFTRQRAAQREANAKAAERAAAAADAKVRDAINATAADAAAALQEASNAFAAQGVAETRARLAKQSGLSPEVDALLRDFAALSVASKDLESAERRRANGLAAVGERMQTADAILEQADAADASLALADAEAYFRERFGDAAEGLGGPGSVIGTFDARAVETFGPNGLAGAGSTKDDPVKIAKDELAVSKQIKEGIGTLIKLFEGFTSNVEAVLDPGLA